MALEGESEFITNSIAQLLRTDNNQQEQIHLQFCSLYHKSTQQGHVGHTPLKSGDIDHDSP